MSLGMQDKEHQSQFPEHSRRSLTWVRGESDLRDTLLAIVDEAKPTKIFLANTPVWGKSELRDTEHPPCQNAGAVLQR